MYTSVTPDEAAAKLLQAVRRTGTEKICTENAGGRVVSRNITIPSPLPPFDRSAYDGYGMRSEDTRGASCENPVTLTVAGAVYAGDPPPCRIAEGEAVKIMTGAMVPEGADCVINFEKVRYTDHTVTLTAPVAPGANINHAGCEWQTGECLLPEGSIVDPPSIGLLCSLGIDEVEVFRKPRIALVMTGSELAGTDDEPGMGMIRDSSGPALRALLKEWGMEIASFVKCPDDPVQITDAIQEAADCDLIITTGGVSVGEKDYVINALERLDSRILFGKIRMKPGSCTIAAVPEGHKAPVLALSGNPGACLTSLYRIARPALRKIKGMTDVRPEEIQAVLTHPVRESGVPRILRGKLEICEGKICFKENAGQRNSMLRGFCGADMQAQTGDEGAGTRAGDTVRAWMIKGL